MQRAIRGLGIGGVCGLAGGFVAVMVIAEPPAERIPSAIVLGGLLGGLGAIAGAVVGATGDIIDFLGKRLPAPTELGPEADYQEPTEPSNPAI